MARRLVLLAAAVVVLSGSEPGVAVVSGPQRLLMIRATWGPQPFDAEQVRRNIQEVDAFFRDSSFGRVSVGGVVTPWLRAFSGPPPSCDRAVIANAVDEAARAAGYDLSAYTQIGYLYPRNDCFWTGARWGKRILLNGTLTVTNTAHELGHTLGLGHAHAWSCAPRPCGMVNQGDPYDTMGYGTGDFNSYEKSQLGWITRLTFPSRAGTYPVAPLEKASRLPQGLIVTTAGNRYWFEVRTEAARDEDGKFLAPPGVLVHIGPNPALDRTNSRYGLLSNALIMDPVGRGSPPLRAGDRFTERGAFRIEVLKGNGANARLRFAWADRTPPSRPALRLPQRRDGSITVSWRDSFERGSGIAHYKISLDGGPAIALRQRAYPAANTARFDRVGSGAHTVAIVAVDRAGNRSRPALRRFTLGGS